MTLITDEQLQQAYRYAVSLTNDRDTARDIVHSAYANMLGKRNNAINNQQSYFLRAVRNVFIDKKRFDSRWPTLPEDENTNTLDISLDSLESTTINQDLLKKLWAQLNPLERELLYLWAVEEYTIDEISHLTDTARGTLLSRIHRIRKKVIEKNTLVGVRHENHY